MPARRWTVSSHIARHHVNQDVDGAAGAAEQPRVNPVQPPDTLLDRCEIVHNLLQLRGGAGVEQIGESGGAHPLGFQAPCLRQFPPQNSQFPVQETDFGAEALLIRNVLACRLQVHTDKGFPAIAKFFGHQAQTGDSPLEELDVQLGCGLFHRSDRDINVMLRLTVLDRLILFIHF